MAANPLAKKLGIKPGMRVLAMNLPAPELREALAEATGTAVSTRRSGGAFDAVLVFARLRRELEAAAAGACAAVEPGGLLWIGYPKAAALETDLKRDLVWEAMAPTGWRPVSQVAVDEVWSALRFRPQADVKSKKKQTAKVAAKKTTKKTVR